MKWISLFEDFEKSKFKVEEIRKCIRQGGVIYATIVNEYPGNDPDKPMKPLSVDDDGDISVEIDGQEHIVKLKNVEKIDYYDGKNKQSL